MCCCCCCYLRLQYLRDSGLIHVPDKERCVVVVVVIYDFSTYVIVVLSMYQTKRGVCCCCYLRLQYLRDSGLIHVPDKERCVVVVVIVIYDFSTYVTVVLSMYQTKRGVCCYCYLRLQYLRDSGLIHVPDKERCVLLLLLLFTTSVLT